MRCRCQLWSNSKANGGRSNPGGIITLEQDGRLEPTFPGVRHYLGRADWERPENMEALSDPHSLASCTLAVWRNPIARKGDRANFCTTVGRLVTVSLPALVPEPPLRGFGPFSQAP